jgi:hypothetical protein
LGAKKSLARSLQLLYSAGFGTGASRAFLSFFLHLVVLTSRAKTRAAGGGSGWRNDILKTKS